MEPEVLCTNQRTVLIHQTLGFGLHTVEERLVTELTDSNESQTRASVTNFKNFRNIVPMKKDVNT
jgi:hypothetical protein